MKRVSTLALVVTSDNREHEENASVRRFRLIDFINPAAGVLSTTGYGRSIEISKPKDTVTMSSRNKRGWSQSLDRDPRHRLVLYGPGEVVHVH